MHPSSNLTNQSDSLTLREKLAANVPVVTLELSPPKGTDVSLLIEQAKSLTGLVDAINVPDCQLAILKMSAMAGAKLIQDQTGIETIWQMTCRDRNAIALQSDLMGGYALGLHNVLALTGDPVQLGDQRETAKQVFHLDSTRLLTLISQLNRGQDATGKELRREGTGFLVGAALNPFKVFKRAQQLRLQQKIERGVDFFQTQPVYDADSITAMIEAVKEAADNVGKPAPKILVGLIPPKSASAARYMNKSVVGVEIPESFVDLLERSDDPPLESMKFCVDLIEAIRPVNPHFHLMPVGMVARIPWLLRQSFHPELLKTASTGPTTHNG